MSEPTGEFRWNMSLIRWHQDEDRMISLPRVVARQWLQRGVGWVELELTDEGLLIRPRVGKKPAPEPRSKVPRTRVRVKSLTEKEWEKKAALAREFFASYSGS